jgi:hypothetical protein
MVKSADTADLKSADLKGSWEFKSPSGHQSLQVCWKAYSAYVGAQCCGFELLVVQPDRIVPG